MLLEWLEMGVETEEEDEERGERKEAHGGEIRCVSCPSLVGLLRFRNSL